MGKYNVAKVKDLYECVKQLMDENKGECEVCVNSVNCEDTFEVITEQTDRYGNPPFILDNDILWIQVISNRNDCPCDCECNREPKQCK